MKKFIIFVVLITTVGSAIISWNCNSTREIFQPCPQCPGSCQRPKPRLCIIPCTFECVCRRPYIRNKDTGKCVKQCPKPPTTETTILTTAHDDNPYNGTIRFTGGIH